MASKRKLDEFLEVEKNINPAFKNSLDSDEEDDEEKEENYDVMHEDDLEGIIQHTIISNIRLIILFHMLRNKVCVKSKNLRKFQL